MARVSTYLNFAGTTEEAFEHYRSLFGGEFGQISRFGDEPMGDGPQVPEADRDKVMHMDLTITGGHVLHGTDMLASMGQELRVGNNTTIFLELDRREEVDRLFAGLSEDGNDQFGPQDMPWGMYWATCLDRFGVRWMLGAS